VQPVQLNSPVQPNLPVTVDPLLGKPYGMSYGRLTVGLISLLKRAGILQFRSKNGVWATSLTSGSGSGPKISCRPSTRGSSWPAATPTTVSACWTRIPVGNWSTVAEIPENIDFPFYSARETGNLRPQVGGHLSGPVGRFGAGASRLLPGLGRRRLHRAAVAVEPAADQRGRRWFGFGKNWFTKIPTKNFPAENATPSSILTGHDAPISSVFVSAEHGLVLSSSYSTPYSMPDFPRI